MRKLIAAALLALLPSPAFAQNAPTETVGVDAAKTLTGLWKISFPQLELNVSLPLMGTGHFRLMVGETFCRIEQKNDDLSVTCLSSGAWRTGTANLDGKNLHLAWGGALVRFVIDAALQSASAFSGSFSLKLMGVRHDAAAPTTGEKFNLPLPRRTAPAKPVYSPRHWRNWPMAGSARRTMPPSPATSGAHRRTHRRTYSPSATGKPCSIWVKDKSGAGIIKNRCRPFFSASIRLSSPMAKGCAASISAKTAYWMDSSAFKRDSLFSAALR